MFSLALSGRLVVVGVSVSQGGGEYALPWARYRALSGRKIRDATRQKNCVDTIG